MSDILNFSQFINESFKFKNIKFNSHKNHNPSADIIEGHIDGDTFITYGIYVNGPKKGEEFMEIYTGENYKVGSTKKSHSRVYSPDKIPSKYKSMWTDLKNTYKSDYVNESADLLYEGDVNYKNDKYALVRIGGSIGSGGSYPVFVGRDMGSIIETGDDKESFTERAASMRKSLSPGERKYYGMNYKVIELTPRKIKEIEMLISHRNSAEDTNIE